jgi:hypothetical protein
LLSAAKGKKQKPAYLGQTCPPDMEFIPGNGDIQSFFISKSQETNLNYSIYLDWLQRVYVDYPEVAINAQPHDVEQGLLYNYNDPVLRGNQLRNPAFAYYPVTGVDWLQIQEYMSWKTDRLNESILIELGYLKPSPDGIDEDNFNTEAFILKQYEGKRGKRTLPEYNEIYSKDIQYTSGKDTFTKRYLYDIDTLLFAEKFNFLFGGYRLPTEAEWEYAANSKFVNKIKSKTSAFPFGKDYFLFSYIFPDTKTKDSILTKTNKVNNQQQVKGANTYDNHFYGIYNMGNNVKEWLLDEYSPIKKVYKNTSDIYIQNEFVTAKRRMYGDAEDVVKIKDSLGTMLFRFMGIDENGNDLKIMRYRYSALENYYPFNYDVNYYNEYNFFIKKKFNPDSLKIKEIQLAKIKEKFGKYKTVKIYAENDYGNKMNQIVQKDHNVYANLSFYRSEVIEEKGRKMEVFILDTLKVLNSPEYVQERMFISYSRSNPNARVVKSGTWRNPSTTTRESIKETDASADVGFRAVIPYLRMPLEKKYMVKWK